MTATTVCVLCPDRGRIPNRPPICDACRSELARLPVDIRDYAARLTADPDLVPDDRVYRAPMNTPRPPLPAWVVQQHAASRAERANRQYDPAVFRAELAAEGLVSASPASAPARWTRDEIAAIAPSTALVSRLPFDPDRVDLLAGARPATRALHARGILGLDPDQDGHLSLRTALDPWIRDWAHSRRESLPPARTGPMLGWLRQRVGWACDTLDVDQLAGFRDELRSYRSTMRALLGEAELIDRKVGVSCPSCHNWSLFRANGSDWIECGDCPSLMSQQEYADYTGWRAGVCGGCISRIETARLIPA